MRLAGKVKLGYFPLPHREAERIRTFLKFPRAGTCAVLDPCIGDGAAFAIICQGSGARLYGIELDSYRAEQAAAVAHQVIRGDAFNVHCPVESFSLLYLNPPYDFECSDGQNRRMEQLFLAQFFRSLKPGGVLILVVPGNKLHVCNQILALNFRNKSAYRLSEPECIKYKQVVLFGVRRTRHERDRMRDSDVMDDRRRIAEMSRAWEQLPILPDRADVEYSIPESRLAQLVNRGLPLDEIEDLLPRSAAYRQASRILFAPPPQTFVQPLTPLHAGHTGLLAVSSMLDGIFGAGEDRHISAWCSVKLTETSEEVEDDGTIIQRERERFSNELTLIFESGKTAILH